jgi:DnaJ family protein A protein 2
MNFEDFFGGGGFPGGFPGGGARFHGGFPGGDDEEDEETKKEGYLRELGLDNKASVDDIKRAYKKLALKHHPDRPGGNAEKFKKIQDAYDSLTADPKAKPSGRSNGPPKRKLKPTEETLDVTLEDLYTGATRTVAYTRKVICKICSGKGGQEVTPCVRCSGRGAILVDRRLGPMIQRMQIPCDRCEGKGEIIPESKKCVPCRGLGRKSETKAMSVEIQKGMKHGEKIVFDEEGDQHPEVVSGDFVVQLRQSEHSTMKRSKDGFHIVVEKRISLLEALTGFQFTIQHLDGRTLLVNSEPNTIYKDREIRAIKDEGFPVKNAHVNGHIIINLMVDMPTSLDNKEVFDLPRADRKTLLGRLLGGSRRRPSVEAAILKKAAQDTAPYEEETKSTAVHEVTLERIDLEAENSTFQKILRAHGEPDDEDEEGQGVRVGGCQAQ